MQKLLVHFHVHSRIRTILVLLRNCNLRRKIIWDLIFTYFFKVLWTRGSAVGQEFSLLHIAQTSSGAHPDSYAMGS
jgi:hypothetical protein